MLLSASDPFYKSGTFWAAGAVVAALLVGAGTMWAALRAANPKRRIEFWMKDTPLLRDHRTLSGHLEVLRNGSTLADPRLVRVLVRNSSRRDVASAAFDQGTPLRMNLGVPILDVLSTEVKPATAQAPPSAVDGSELRIGPGRIGRGSQVTYLLLVDGRPTFSCQHSLIDVTVTEAEDIYLTGTMVRTRSRGNVFALGAAAVAAILTSYLAPLIEDWLK
ncbi:hypothetical protein [Streptomyces sp. WAC06614]|uniref:hypothetical protein n=1 Tax=Streptomyces sp. WAC06614 TaxID=2487416 RepID=UPI000F7A6525|nr:hypothetical protein [Streptomyces sp. WAC06614]RSS79503.1 hypothetical protein EF918_17230 [Streptomyces sp. WAC06614]